MYFIIDGPNEYGFHGFNCHPTRLIKLFIQAWLKSI